LSLEGCEALQFNVWVPTFLKKDSICIYTLKLQMEEFHSNIHCHENFKTGNNLSVCENTPPKNIQLLSNV